MEESSKETNYDRAKLEADKADLLIAEALKKGQSFLVEAGAGSGKTYSLNQAATWVQENKWAEYRKKAQSAVCITYTNAAVEVIKGRLPENSPVLPRTIHAFAWETIKQYQGYLVKTVVEKQEYLPDEGDFARVAEVRYTLGHRYKENGIQYLYHDDVLKLFCELLDNEKFRRMFSNRYPLILIDEYQDSYGPIIERFIKYFIEPGAAPQFGFFGDAWQTIYQSNKACGAIPSDKLEVIRKGSNFRSAPQIVRLLNIIRPDLPQTSAIDGFEGEVVTITNDDYSGPRRIERNFKDELPPDVLRGRLNEVTGLIRNSVLPEETTKTLMITHKVLASQQGYDELLAIIGDALRGEEDAFLLFFKDVVEPVYSALCESDHAGLFEALGVKRYPISKKSDKKRWHELRRTLESARDSKAIDVISAVVESGLVPIPPNIENWMSLYRDKPDTLYASSASIEQYLGLDYQQFVAAIEFLQPDASFSTEHGVKGEEYDNVVFAIGRGWNMYQFDVYAPMITGKIPIPSEKQSSFERNRNLFYVCCSRPRKRLFFFVSMPLSPEFRSFLQDLAGKENCYEYGDFLRKWPERKIASEKLAQGDLTGSC